MDNIIDAAGITKDDFVLEIGPGIGTMTQRLCEEAREVVAVEIDKALIPILDDTLSTYKNWTVINQDILKVDMKFMQKNGDDGRSERILASIVRMAEWLDLMVIVEGVQIMRILGRNMAWFLRMRKAAGDAGITPPQPEKDVYFTNFIR